MLDSTNTPEAGPSRPRSSQPLPSTDFPAFLAQTTKSLDTVTTQAAGLPGKSDLNFHRTLDRKLAKDLQEASTRVLAVAERLLSHLDRSGQSSKGKVARVGPARSRLLDLEDVTEMYRRNIVGTVDSLLEDADTCLDEIKGQRKKAAIAIDPTLAAQAGVKQAGPFSAKKRSLDDPLNDDRAALESRPKPQASFPDNVDNSIDRPAFTPTLPVKHHALVPLDYDAPIDIELSVDPSLRDVQMRQEREIRRHPYWYETRHLPYPTSMFTASEPTKPDPIDPSQATFVDTPAQLAEMVAALKEAKEIAVDLEHHDTLSYYGFTCLMQISTREQDWVVDTLKLRGALREDKLGGVFADPSIVKVFHGAESDIVWLQKDFDIYVVNLFDTYHATKVLDMTGHSLRFLLKLYCGFDAKKEYQRADWRVRPLSKEMMLYAQADTHYLLYIYDNLRYALLGMSRAPSVDPDAAEGTGERAASPRLNPQKHMRQVLDRSALTALQVYSRQGYDKETGHGNGGWKATMKRYLPSVSASAASYFIFKALHAWRDQTARRWDITPTMVMSGVTLKKLALTQASTVEAFARLLDPRLKDQAGPLFEVVEKARQTWSEQRHMDVASEEDSASIQPPAAESVAQPVLPTITHTLSVKPIEVADVWDMDVHGIEAPDVGSSLFGGSLASSRVSKETPEASSSSLFGQTLRPTKTATSPFEALKRSLQAELAPPVVEKVAKEAETEKDNGAGKATMEPETVAFVPVEQRTTLAPVTTTTVRSEPEPKKASVVEDGIVQIGRSKKHQRESRTDAQPQEGSSSASIVTPLSIVIRLSTDSKALSDKDTKVLEDQLDLLLRKEEKDQGVTVGEADALVAKANTKGTKRVQARVARLERILRFTTIHVDAAASNIDEEALRSFVRATEIKLEAARAELQTGLTDFDYATAPNLLDNPNSSASGRPAKKAKKSKGGVQAVTDTTYGKVPKDNTQPKVGNRSMTFGA